MTGRTTTPTTATGCPFCAMHNHGACRGGECACERRAHNPDVETAASMRLYERPDLAAAKLPVECLASDWHRKDEHR
jgi:hypothetical protein